MLQIDQLVFNAWWHRFHGPARVTPPNPSEVGLVGRNKIGRSAPFKLIRSELQTQRGEFTIPEAAGIAAVDLEHPATAARLLETILAADTERAWLMAEFETADPERITNIGSHLIEFDADGAPARASEILAGLDFSQ